MAINSNAQKIMYDISEIFYRNGKYGLERISIICKIIKSLLWIKKQQGINELKKLEDIDSIMNEATYNAQVGLDLYLSKKDIHSLYYGFIELMDEDNKDIADAIQQLVNNDKRTSGFIPTDDFSVRIMQTFARRLYNNGTYIDPCVGTGRLLAGLDSERIYGLDINEMAISIADAYLNLLEYNDSKSRMSLKLSTENFLYKDIAHSNDFLLPTYIFDPPLNVPLEISDEKLSYLIRDNIYPGKGKIPSEYLFLAKILFSANNDVNYISTFLDNFLFAQDKFKKEFRRYLIRYSLIAIIQSNFDSGINKLILVGKARSECKPEMPIYLITPKDENLPQEILDKIADKISKKEHINKDEYYEYAKIDIKTVNELAENDYRIIMPQYYESEIDPQNIKPVAVITEDLKISNENLIDNSKQLEEFLNNLLNGVKNISTTIGQAEPLPQIKPKNWFDEPFSDLNNAIGIFAEEKELDWTSLDFVNTHDIDLANLDSCIHDLRLLYKAKRLRYNNGVLEIYSKEHLLDSAEQELFSQYIIETNNSDLFYENISANLSEKQVEIFNNYIKFYFDYDDSNEKNNTHLYANFERYSAAEIHSAIATLKTLGLLYDNPNIDDGIEKHLPYVALLNVKEVA